ncbi:MAG: hypothetical protein ACFFD2_07790 [Promethearchaeota archaeon]
MFDKLWEGALDEIKGIRFIRYGRTINYRTIPRSLLKDTIPDAEFRLTFPEIVNGEIIDIILEIL